MSGSRKSSPVADPIPRPHESTLVAAPSHAIQRGNPSQGRHTSLNASVVRPTRKSGLPSHPYPISSRLNAS